MKKYIFLSAIITILILIIICLPSFSYSTSFMLYPSDVWHDAVNDANNMDIDYCWVLGDLIEGRGYYPNGIDGMWNDFNKDYNRINVTTYRGLVKGNHDTNYNFTSDYTYTIGNILFIISSDGNIINTNTDNMNVFVLCHYPPVHSVTTVDFWLHGHLHVSPTKYKVGNMPVVSVTDITHKYGDGAESTFWYFYENSSYITCNVFNHQKNIFTNIFEFYLKYPSKETFSIWFCSDVHIGGYKGIIIPSE